MYQRNSKLYVFGMAGMLFANLVNSDWAFALDLTAPMNLETAQVLPAGVRNPRFMNIFMSADTKFNGGGQTEPLGNPLSRVVKWSDVIGLQSNDMDKNTIRSVLNDSQLSVDGSPGSTTGQVNTYLMSRSRSPQSEFPTG